MTFKSKVQIAAAVLVGGLIAWAAWPRKSESKLRLTVTGLASNSFAVAITNIFHDPIQYFLTSRYRVDTNDVGAPLATGTLAGQSATNHVLAAPTAGEWRIHLAYAEPSPESLGAWIRENLADLANDCGLQRLSVWFAPKARWKDIYGPEMLGNKAAPSFSK